MLIKCDPIPLTSFSAKIRNNQIAHTNCTKYLGVILDDKLSWYQHITNLQDKSAQSLGIFYLTRHQKKVHGDQCQKTSLNRLNVLRNELIQAISFASYRSHVTLLYHQSNLLKINYIHHLEIGKLMHCLHNGKLPQTFDGYFVPVTSVHTHVTRKATHGKYFLHSFSSEHGKR